MPRKSKTVISDASQLQGFKLLERFREVFARLDARRTKSPRELDTRRKFDAADYYSMVLFTLLNPVIDSMRGLCAASKLEEYNIRTGLPSVSLGSFSEAQSVFDLELLCAVLRELMEDVAGDPPESLSKAMKGKKLEAIDSSLWEVLPRMGWAHWREQYSTSQNAVRLHLRWRLFEPGTGGARLVAARECERSVLRHGLLESGVVYVGDRNYSGDYSLLRRMDEVGASFVVRLQDKAVIEEIEKIPVSEKDRKRGVTHHQRVALGFRDALSFTHKCLYSCEHPFYRSWMSSNHSVSSSSDFISKEISSVILGDRRLVARAAKVISHMERAPDKSLNSTFNGAIDTQAAYRFFENENVSAKAMIEAHRPPTIGRCEAHDLLLLAQDTSELDFSSNTTLKGAGIISQNQNSHRTGFFLHARYLLGGNHVPLGIWGMDFGVRDPNGPWQGKSPRETSHRGKKQLPLACRLPRSL